MAPPSSRGSSRSGSSRSGSSSRGGNSTNTAATVVAVAVVGLIVGVVILMSGGKKEPPKPSLPASSSSPVVKTPDVVKPPPAYPAMPPEKVSEVAALVKTFEADGAKAESLYSESQKAKKDGDDTAWQAKVGEMAQLLDGINRKWNSFIDSLPSNNDYNIEEVARHYFGKESGRVAQLTKKLAAVKTDQK